ncbi:ABC transporter G family member 11 [Spatholobus suberectus]|nr:ABC transporter G family member 11 [Spatholobus suberectus]
MATAAIVATTTVMGVATSVVVIAVVMVVAVTATIVVATMVVVVAVAVEAATMVVSEEFSNIVKLKSNQEFVTTVDEEAIIKSKERNTSTKTKEGSIFLTWEDLQVTVPNGRNGRKPILKGLTGYAKPGQLLTIMGPSGCGKSTLLDALAGRLVSSTKQTGKILINGHRHALAYGTSFFASNGFPCPPLHNPSDHFLRIINKDFKLDDEECFHITVPKEKAVDILVEFYKSSEISNQVQKEVAAIGESEYGFMERSRTQAAFLTQCHILLRRSSVHLFRDVSNYWLRLAMFVVAAISLGTIFFDVGSRNASIQARGSLVSFVASVLTFITLLGGFPSFVEQMKVFQRERLNGHYGVAAFVISHTLSPIPYMDLNVAYTFLLLLACILWVESLMMVASSIFPNPNAGITVSGGIMGIMILTGGFFRLPNDLPKPFWKYPMYYVSFHKYAFQGLFKNEFIGLKLASDQDGGTYLSDKEILTKIWQVEMGHSKWVDLAIMLGTIVLYRLVFLAIIKSKEKMKACRPRVNYLINAQNFGK